MTPAEVIAKALEDAGLDLTPMTCRDTTVGILKRLERAGFTITPKFMPGDSVTFATKPPPDRRALEEQVDAPAHLRQQRS
jgi:hypothetical protein